MRRLLSFLLIISFSLTVFINGQNLDGCRNGEITIPDPNWRTVPSRFEIVTELISQNEVAEISQAFSSTADSIIFTAAQGSVQFFWNYVTNETFDILNIVSAQRLIKKCVRQVIIDSSQTSVIQPGTLILKPSVLLGFTGRNQRNQQWGTLYSGDTQLRGIPANIFKGCFYVPDIKATVSVIYYVSDVTKFQAYIRGNESIILQMDVDIRNEDGRQEQYSYNVMRFMPTPRREEERHALETPKGVYCPNRTSTLAMPSNLPDQVAANSESLVPQLNQSIISAHNLYDTESRFVSFNIWYPDPKGGALPIHYSEVHDYATGLSYQYNHLSRLCAVGDINSNFNDAVTVDGKPNLIQMGSPQHLFLMEDVTYQYSGEKRCRDHVWCHVWIAEIQYPNNTVQHREWYWVSRFHGQPVKEIFPVKTILSNSVNDTLLFTVESIYFNFRRNPITYFEVDSTITECYRALGPSQNYNLAVLSFTLENEKNVSVLQNLNYLRFHIIETLIIMLRIRPTRISNVIVDKDGYDILVTFTLLDTPPRRGPVEAPVNEPSLDRLTQRLTSMVDSEGLIFRARDDKKEVILRARNGSLNVQFKAVEEVFKTSGPRITGLWIGFVILGLVVGGVIAFFAFAKFAN